MISDRIKMIFSFAQLQDFYALLQFLKRDGTSVEEFERYVEEAGVKKNERDRKMRLLFRQKCPECGTPLRLHSVNTGPANQTGDDSTFVWVCHRCRREEWRTDTIDEILTELDKRRA